MAAIESFSRNLDLLYKQIQEFSSTLSNHYGFDPVKITITSFVLLVVTTRVITGWLGGSTKVDSNATQKVPLLPYWIPILGHMVNLILMPSRLLKGTRLAY